MNTKQIISIGIVLFPSVFGCLSVLEKKVRTESIGLMKELSLDKNRHRMNFLSCVDSFAMKHHGKQPEYVAQASISECRVHLDGFVRLSQLYYETLFTSKGESNYSSWQEERIAESKARRDGIDLENEAKQNAVLKLIK